MSMQSSSFARYPGLSGAAVMISGGASGIGEAIVRAYAGEGAKVGFVDLAEAEGEALAAELNAAGGSVTFRRCDITDADGLQGGAARDRGACRARRRC